MSKKYGVHEQLQENIKSNVIGELLNKKYA